MGEQVLSSANHCSHHQVIDAGEGEESRSGLQERNSPAKRSSGVKRDLIEVKSHIKKK